VDAHITILNGDESTEVNELFHWLGNYRDVRNTVTTAIGGDGATDLSATVEIIVAAIGSGGISQLISSLRSWLRTRTPELIIEVTTEKGRVKLTARDFDDDQVAELMRILLGADRA
jgi:hypothetical protein